MKISIGFKIVLYTLFMFEVLMIIGEKYSLFYVPEKFQLNYFSELKNTNNPLGWENYHGSQRPVNIKYENNCLAAFGDSFTHADEVEHDEAWPFLLSQYLECNVLNFGSHGYGQDQSLLRFRKKKKTLADNTFIIFGVYQEMLRRNLSASHLFYSDSRKNPLKPFFILKDGSLKNFTPVNIKTTRMKKNYHKFDYYYQPYRLEFPFTFNIFKLFFKRIYSEIPLIAAREVRSDVFSNNYATKLENQILKAAYNETNNHVGFIFFSTPEQLKLTESPYSDYFNQLTHLLPKACLIDTFDFLKYALKTSKTDLRAHQGHYNSEGNAIIAKFLSKALVDCQGSNLKVKDGS